jgi:hypothetical protein
LLRGGRIKNLIYKQLDNGIGDTLAVEGGKVREYMTTLPDSPITPTRFEKITPATNTTSMAHAKSRSATSASRSSGQREMNHEVPVIQPRWQDSQYKGIGDTIVQLPCCRPSVLIGGAARSNRNARSKNTGEQYENTDGADIA